MIHFTEIKHDQFQQAFKTAFKKTVTNPHVSWGKLSSHRKTPVFPCFERIVNVICFWFKLQEQGWGSIDDLKKKIMLSIELLQTLCVGWLEHIYTISVTKLESGDGGSGNLPYLVVREGETGQCI